MVQIPQSWFEMDDIRRRRYARSGWIPLRQSEMIKHEGEENRFNCKIEFIGTTSVAVPLENKDQAEEECSWATLGLCHDGGPFASADGTYKHSEICQSYDEDLGVDLIIIQYLNAEEPSIWRINQDLILALNLKKEDDFWVRPEEGYEKVIRERKDDEGRVISIEIKSEYLKDYLAARGMALRIFSYKQRYSIVHDSSHINWDEDHFERTIDDGRFVGWRAEVDDEGAPPDRSMAVFSSWRTDVDDGEDVPMFDAENDGNTDFSSFSSSGRAVNVFTKIEGQFYRDEWIDPSRSSLRVREDAPEHESVFIVDAAGGRQVASELCNEDIGKYLWFLPDVVIKLLAVRGGELNWYTGMTGSVNCSSDYRVYFGINDSDLITVYAFDIARLPSWQQKIWEGSNVTPEGGVSSELLAAQMRCQPSSSKAPENTLKENIESVGSLFIGKTSLTLFRNHIERDKIFTDIHRFKASNLEGILNLAKDVIRVTVELLDIANLRKVIGDDVDKALGSIKLLERYLTLFVGPEEARSLLTIIVGVNELRIANSHLPSSQISEAFDMVGIDQRLTSIQQGKELLEKVSEAWANIASVLESKIK